MVLILKTRSRQNSKAFSFLLLTFKEILLAILRDNKNELFPPATQHRMSEKAHEFFVSRILLRISSTRENDILETKKIIFLKFSAFRSSSQDRRSTFICFTLYFISIFDFSLFSTPEENPETILLIIP